MGSLAPPHAQHGKPGVQHGNTDAGRKHAPASDGEKRDGMLRSAVRSIVISSLLVSIFTGCDLLTFNHNNGEEKVARVHDKYLYTSDLKRHTEGLNPSDSAVVVKRVIDAWIKEQLMLQKAELELPEEQKDFEKQIEEYHKSLLIYSYRQKLLQQKLDTAVSNEEIRSYYEKNLNNFILAENVIRGTYVKVLSSAPRVNEVRAWSRSNTAEALDELEKYCINYAERYSDFNETWIYFSSIADQIPITISNPARYLMYNRNIERSDSLYHYFLHIADHKPDGDVAPLEMVLEDIKSIILNKRKIEFFQDLEIRVYNEGVSRNQFEIY
jgi:hypothetical protein